MNYDADSRNSSPSNLGWPEGPTVMPDGSVVFVESYRSQLTVVGKDGKARQFAYTTGAPNSCVLGSDGALYVCQNGGTVGPWRAAEMSVPSIQRVGPAARRRSSCTEVDGIKLNGPNDLVFAPDGTLVFTDPGTYNPANPDPSYIYALAPDGTATVKVTFDEADVPERRRGRGRRLDRLGRILHRPCPAPAARRQDRGSRPHARRQSDPRRHDDRQRTVRSRHRPRRRRHPRPGARRHAQGLRQDRRLPDQLAFDGETLWITDASVLASSAEPNYAGQLWRMTFPGGGAPTYKGSDPDEGAAMSARETFPGLSYKGKVAFVTGGGSGIGLETALTLADLGADVAVLDWTPGAAAQTAREVEKIGRKALAFTGDAGDEKTVVDAFAADAPPSSATIDVAVACAGVLGEGGPVFETSVDDFEQVMGVNVRGSFLVVREAAKEMRKRKQRRHRAAVQPRRPAGRARHVLLLRVQGRAAQPGARRGARSRARSRDGELRLPERHLHAAARRPAGDAAQRRRGPRVLCRAASARPRADAARYRRRRSPSSPRRSPPASPARPSRSTPASAPPGTIFAIPPG